MTEKEIAEIKDWYMGSLRSGLYGEEWKSHIENVRTPCAEDETYFFRSLRYIRALLDEVDRLRADLEMAQDEINDLANQLGGRE